MTLIVYTKDKETLLSRECHAMASPSESILSLRLWMDMGFIQHIRMGHQEQTL